MTLIVGSMIKALLTVFALVFVRLGVGVLGQNMVSKFIGGFHFK